MRVSETRRFLTLSPSCQCFGALRLCYLLGLVFPVCMASDPLALHQVTLRAGVVPEATITDLEELPNGTLIVEGFHVKLMDHIKSVAKGDGIDLIVEYAVVSKTYNEAFDRVANDCLNLTDTKEEDCNKFDIITADFFPNRIRAQRADLTPSYIAAAIGAAKVDQTGQSERTRPDYSTFEEANKYNATICVPEGSLLSRVVMASYPGAGYLWCGDNDSCAEELLAGSCDLFVGGMPHFRVVANVYPGLIFIPDEINKNFFVWAMNKVTLPQEIRDLMKEWIYAAVLNGAVEEALSYFFDKCPVGYAGPSCEEPCDPNHGKASPSGACICDSAKWTGKDCSQEVMEDTNMIPTWQLAVGYVMFSTNILVVTGCAMWLHMNKDIPRIQLAQPLFLWLILLGCAVSSTTIPALMQQAGPGDTVDHCMAPAWLYSIGFCISHGTLSAKIRRTHQIFKSSVEMRKVQITIWSALQEIGVILLVDVVILTVWSIVDPLEWERKVTAADKYLNPLESNGYCISEHWNIFVGIIGGFHLLLIIVACYMCYLTRDIPDSFTGGNFTSVAMFSNLQILLLGVPLALLVGNNASTRFFIQSTIIWISDIVVVFIIFGTLFFKIRAERNAAVSLRQLVRTGMQTYKASATKKSKGKSNSVGSASASAAPYSVQHQGTTALKPSCLETSINEEEAESVYSDEQEDPTQQERLDQN